MPVVSQVFGDGGKGDDSGPRSVGPGAYPCHRAASEPMARSVARPGNISVGPDQHGGGSAHRADYRKTPFANIFRIGQLNATGPWTDVDAAGLTEVQQHRPGVVQQGEYAQRAVGGEEIEIGHAASEQRVSSPRS